MIRKNYENIRIRIIIAIGIGVVITTIIGILISNSVINHFDEDSLSKQMKISQAMYQQSLTDDTDTLSGIIYLLQNDKVLQNLFIERDRDLLLVQSQELFKHLRDTYRITHFYYHLPAGQNFLRVHSPTRHDDQIERITMQRAMASHELSSGIELGPLGTFTLRVVVPWKRDGEIIGYLELGEEIEHVTQRIATLMHVDLALIVCKKYTTRDGWQQGQQLMGRSGDWNLLKNYALLNTSFDFLSPPIIAYLQNIVDIEGHSSHAWRVTPSLLAQASSLADVSGHELGHFIIFVDTSDSIQDLHEATVKYASYSLSLLVLLLVLYWAYLGRIEQSIRQGKKELSRALEEQQEDQRKLEDILSTMGEGFILTMPPGRNIMQANTKMVEMLGLPEEQLLGCAMTDFISHESLVIGKAMTESLNRGEQVRGELLVGNDTNGYVPCLVTASPVFNATGEVTGSFSTWNDISDYKKTLNRLLETEENFNRVFYYTQDAVAIISGDQLVSCNEPFATMLGAADQAEVLEINSDSLSPEFQSDGRSSHEKAEAMIAIAIDKGFHRFEWLHRKVSGEIFPVEVSLNVLHHKGEVELHCLWKDLSKQKEYEHNLWHAAEDAKAASRSKDEFLANMSHEIRTPMNGIIGLTRLTLDTELPEKQRGMLENVLYSAENLLGLLNDILDFSKIEAGQLTLEQHDFSLEAMMNHLVSTLSFQAQDKQLLLEDCSNYAVLPKYIKADELRLRQVVINLIGNGIKFTPAGVVTICVENYSQHEDEHVLHFMVTDTGIGIPEDKQQSIFSTFTQADTSTARNYGGTGLGLAISKQLVELMGGKIWLESVEGLGTTFHFTVHVQPGEDEAYSSSTSNIDKLHKKLQILLVEDNKFNQDVAVAVLENDGHKVEVANHGLEALEKLASESWDVVFMDVQMPVLDGLTTTEIIRQCEVGKLSGNDIAGVVEPKLITQLSGTRIPIIAMTANAMSGDRQKCLDAGMDEYLTKPFMPDHIHSVLHRLFTENGVNGKGSADNSDDTLITQSTLLPAQVAEHLKAVYGMDDGRAQQMVKNAASSLAETLLEIEGAIVAKDYSDLNKTAHKIGGVLLTLGLVPLGEQAQEIEHIAAGKNLAVDIDDFVNTVKAFIGAAQGE